MTVALVMTYNGRRDCLEETIASLSEYLSGPVTFGVLVDDSASSWTPMGPIPKLLNGPWIIHSHGENRGLAAAVQSGWKAALEYDAKYVCHWEDDMVLERPLDLASAVAALDAHDWLAQVCFARHPVNGAEHAHGGQVRARVADSTSSFYDDCHGVTVCDDLFSLNPCLIPRKVCELGWPSGPLGVGNEAGFTAKCKEADLFFGTLGTVDDPPFVRHIGNERAAAWRL